MEQTILSDIILILLLSLILSIFFQKLKLPSILGFLLAGMFLGPEALGLIQNTNAVEQIAEVGIILLLFSIGIEFSQHEMSEMKGLMFKAGSLQVILTLLAGTAIAMSFGFPIHEGIFYGFLLALSSTAIVIKLLIERGEIDTSHGNISLAVLIFQDLAVVPFMLLLPLLTGAGYSLTDSLMRTGQMIVYLLFLYFIGTRVIPAILDRIARSYKHEIFLMTIILICLLIAWSCSEMGLSPALGAFLAGLIISRSEYSHLALGQMIPFRDSISNLFFVVIGMLLNVHYLFTHITIILMYVCMIIIIKVVLISIICMILGFSGRSSLHAGIALAQIGEFSFILATAGLKLGMFTNDTIQLFISCAVISMAMTPILMGSSTYLSDKLNSKGFFHQLDTKKTKKFSLLKNELEDHVIIVGFGYTGQNIARALRLMEIPYIIMEINSDLIKEYKKTGENIIFGDATQSEVLHLCNTHLARMMTIAVSDYYTSQKITECAAKFNSNLQIVVRTRYLREVDKLLHLGAQEVVPDELEISIEILVRILQQYLVPESQIDKLVGLVREETFGMMRPSGWDMIEPRWEHFLSDMKVDFYFANPNSFVADKTIRDLNFQKEYGISIVSIYRDNQIISNPNAEFVINTGDTVVMLGRPQQLMDIESMFE